MSTIGRGVTERAMSRSDGKLIDLLERGGSARGGRMPGRSRLACRSAARMRWVRSRALVNGPTPPGTGRDGDATARGGLELDVADDPPVDDVDADVDDDGAGLEHRRR